MIRHFRRINQARRTWIRESCHRVKRSICNTRRTADETAVIRLEDLAAKVGFTVPNELREERAAIKDEGLGSQCQEN